MSLSSPLAISRLSSLGYRSLSVVRFLLLSSVLRHPLSVFCSPSFVVYCPSSIVRCLLSVVRYLSSLYPKCRSLCQQLTLSRSICLTSVGNASSLHGLQSIPDFRLWRLQNMIFRLSFILWASHSVMDYSISYRLSTRLL